MIRTVSLVAALALATTCAYAADDDDDDDLPAAEVEKIEEVLSALNCEGYEGIEKEDSGIYEVEDAKCEMGTMDIKLDKDHSVILISRY